KASIIGIPLPLCSCGVLPVATQLRKAGAGAAPTLSFLITTPVTGVDSLMATWAFLGWFFTLIRLAVSLVLGLVVGLLAAIFLPEPAPSKTAPAMSTKTAPAKAADACTDGDDCAACVAPAPPHESFFSRVLRMLQYGFWELPGSIAGSVATGLLIGGVITALLPAHVVAEWVGSGFLGVVVSVAVAIPLYVCATGSIPIAAAMMLKGFSPGAALAFLIAGPATNAVGITTIHKLLGLRHLLLYLAVIFFGSLGFGWFFDRLLALSGISVTGFATAAHGDHGPGLIQTLSGVVLFSVVAGQLAWPRLQRIYKWIHKTEEKTMKGNTTCLSVPDMTCNHCKSTVSKLIGAEAGVTEVSVDLTHRTVEIVHDGALAGPELLARLEAAGYPSTVLEK
ncbi:permease, partial [Myxococcota bacterium]|nr:permease [Myxococcota bacterium]